MAEPFAKICNEIHANGAISFARFMELALYSPGTGYYERQREIGKSGDFFTSVSVGNLFGELLAFQFADWFSETRNIEKSTLSLVEAGAHDGQLALDVLTWFKNFRPEIFANLEYGIIEPSAHHRDWQRKKLAEFSEKISWGNNFSEIQPRDFTVVFSNELFDAMPVHRIAWDAKTKRWFEWMVGFDSQRLIWKKDFAPEKISFPKLAPDLLDVLPDGFTSEICPAATQWWTDAAQFLRNGKLVAIDYGLLAEEFFVPERSGGTLRAYSRHHANADLLANPGEQDLTAHANFSALKNAGEAFGLKTDCCVTQSKFLREIFEKTLRKTNDFPEWNSNRRKQFQTLVHPEHLGRPFRILVQSR
jgi:SAM-dependent MidA family methyltransferase